MKTVYILEKFASAEETKASYDQMLEAITNANAVSKISDSIMSDIQAGLDNYKRIMDENPNGHWYGFEGKEQYRSFIYVARDAIRRNPNAKFRVVKAEIDSDATSWLGYKNPVTKENVLRFLYATR